ncbi:MAG: AAA family ATPase [Nitrososphaerales archaeon]|nr:AAA family ATPase [Nitrososphaerales archaeon]
MWTEKYRPSNPYLLVGNEESRLGFIDWLENWKEGEKPALLIGPPGTGKTTLVYATANLLNYRVIDLNASDVRTKEKLERILSPALSSKGLFNEKVLIFLDEVDGIYGRADYGGMEFVNELIKIGRVPVVFAANDEEDERIRKLMSQTNVFHFKRIPPKLIELYLSYILEKEGIKLNKKDLGNIVRSANGDLRAAINTTYAYALAVKEGGISVLHERDETFNLLEGLDMLLSADSIDEIYSYVKRWNGLPVDKVRLIYNSVMSSNLSIEELVPILNALSTIDILIGRINRTQEWRLLRYFDELLAYSLFQTIPRGKVKRSEDSIPWQLKVRIWNESKAFKSIGLKLAKLFHTSSNTVIDLYLPYMAVILKRSKIDLEKFCDLLGFDEGSKKVFMKEVDRVWEAVKR